MHIASSVGIDLGKTTFHLVALDDHGKIVIKKKFSRKQLLAYTANLSSALVGVEACSEAHFIGAALRDVAPPATNGCSKSVIVPCSKPGISR